MTLCTSYLLGSATCWQGPSRVLQLSSLSLLGWWLQRVCWRNGSRGLRPFCSDQMEAVRRSPTERGSRAHSAFQRFPLGCSLSELPWQSTAPPAAACWGQLPDTLPREASGVTAR